MTGNKAKMTLWLFLIICPALIGGCKEKINPVAQIGDDLISAQERSNIAGEQATLQGIKYAIQIFYASNGRYPENINEIQKLMDSPIDPDMYKYNSENGLVTLTNR